MYNNTPIFDIMRHIEIHAEPQWTFGDANCRAITVDFLDSEQEALIYARAWNECAIRTTRPDLLIHVITAPDGTAFLVRVPEEWTR